MFIRFVTTGGTIDKIYFDAMSQFEVGESQLKHILTECLVSFDFDVVSMFRKDSLELTDDDRQKLREYIENDAAHRYVISHGTDTMVGMAVAAVQTVEPGVYLAMSGQVFEAGKVRKNRDANRFEEIR